jgi:hypothetical protein
MPGRRRATASRPYGDNIDFISEHKREHPRYLKNLFAQG